MQVKQMLARRCARVEGLNMLAFANYEYSGLVTMKLEQVLVEFHYKAAIGNDNTVFCFTNSPDVLINGYKDPVLNKILSALIHFTVMKNENPLMMFDTTGMDYMLEHISRAVNKNDLSFEGVDTKMLSTLITFFYTHIHFIFFVKLDEQVMAIDNSIASYKDDLFDYYISFNEKKEINRVKIDSNKSSMSILLEL